VSEFVVGREYKVAVVAGVQDELQPYILVVVVDNEAVAEIVVQEAYYHAAAQEVVGYQVEAFEVAYERDQQKDEVGENEVELQK
jgi:hypothetical protein